MKKQQWAKATAVVLAASLLLPSVIPADTQAKAKIRLSAKKISLKVGQTKDFNPITSDFNKPNYPGA